MDNKNLTVMFTDMQGFTSRTSAQSRHQNIQMIERHKQLLLPIIEMHKGQLIKTIGDALLCVFESPTNAVLAGMHLQRSLKRHNARAPQAEQMLVRVALNSGEVSLHEQDVYGEAVNIASRIEGLAEAGEVYFSEATYLAMNKTEIPTLPLGEFSLAGIAEKVRLYRVLREGESAPKSNSIANTLATKPVPIDCEEPTLICRPQAASIVQRAGVVRRILSFCLDIVIASLLVVFALPASLQPSAAKELPLLVSVVVHGVQGMQSEVVESTGLQMQTQMQALGKPAAAAPARPARGSFTLRLSKRIKEVRDQLSQSALRLSAGMQGLFLIVAVVFLLSHFLLIALTGSTLGSLLLGVRLRTLSGQRPGLLCALIRTLVIPFSAATFGIGFLYALLNPSRQTLHDKLAGVVVLRV